MAKQRREFDVYAKDEGSLGILYTLCNTTLTHIRVPKMLLLPVTIQTTDLVLDAYSSPCRDLPGQMAAALSGPGVEKVEVTSHNSATFTVTRSPDFNLEQTLRRLAEVINPVNGDPGIANIG